MGRSLKVEVTQWAESIFHLLVTISPYLGLLKKSKNESAKIYF
jgi:hypothetical protein